MSEAIPREVTLRTMSADGMALSKHERPEGEHITLKVAELAGELPATDAELAPPPPPKKHNAAGIIIAIILILGVFGYLGYYLFFQEGTAVISG